MSGSSFSLGVLRSFLPDTASPVFFLQKLSKKFRIYWLKFRSKPKFSTKKISRSRTGIFSCTVELNQWLTIDPVYLSFWRHLRSKTIRMLKVVHIDVYSEVVKLNQNTTNLVKETTAITYLINYFTRMCAQYDTRRSNKTCSSLIIFHRRAIRFSEFYLAHVFIGHFECTTTGHWHGLITLHLHNFCLHLCGFNTFAPMRMSRVQISILLMFNIFLREIYLKVPMVFEVSLFWNFLECKFTPPLTPTPRNLCNNHIVKILPAHLLMKPSNATSAAERIWR